MATDPAQPSRRISGARRHAQIQTLNLFGTLTWDAGPFGMIQRAQMFSAAARVVPIPESGHDFAKWHLACQAVELGLKAFLALRGQTIEQLFASYGHRLDRALADAISHGLLDVVPLTAAEQDAIRAVSQAHVERVFEYPSLIFVMTEVHALPSISVCTDIADALVSGLYALCLDHGNP